MKVEIEKCISAGDKYYKRRDILVGGSLAIEGLVGWRESHIVYTRVVLFVF